MESGRRTSLLEISYFLTPGGPCHPHLCPSGTPTGPDPRCSPQARHEHIRGYLVWSTGESTPALHCGRYPGEYHDGVLPSLYSPRSLPCSAAPEVTHDGVGLGGSREEGMENGGQRSLDARSANHHREHGEGPTVAEHQPIERDVLGVEHQVVGAVPVCV